MFMQPMENLDEYSVVHILKSSTSVLFLTRFHLDSLCQQTLLYGRYRGLQDCALSVLSSHFETVESALSIAYLDRSCLHCDCSFGRGFGFDVSMLTSQCLPPRWRVQGEVLNLTVNAGAKVVAAHDGGELSSQLHRVSRLSLHGHLLRPCHSCLTDSNPGKPADQQTTQNRLDLRILTGNLYDRLLGDADGTGHRAGENVESNNADCVGDG